MTTIVSFLPVFTMIGAEGKALQTSGHLPKRLHYLPPFSIALTIVPALAHLLFTFRIPWKKLRIAILGVLLAVGVTVAIKYSGWAGVIIALFAIYHLTLKFIPEKSSQWILKSTNIIAAIVVGVILTEHWQPLGPASGFIPNAIVVMGPIAGLLAFFVVFIKAYRPILRWFLNHKILFLSIPTIIVVIGVSPVGSDLRNVFGWLTGFR